MTTLLADLMNLVSALCVTCATQNGPPDATKDEGGASPRENLRVEPSAATLGAGFRRHLDAADSLFVRSQQEISGLLSSSPESGEAPQTAAAAIETHEAKRVRRNLTLVSAMTPASFLLAVWDDSSPNHRAILSLELTPAPDGDGQHPILRERHWYPELENYRILEYEPAHPQGCFDLRIPSATATAVPGGTCATAEFFLTWLGESPQSEQFEAIISDGVLTQEETFRGEIAYRIERDTYRIEDDQGFASRRDTFWISKSSGLLVGWITDLVAIPPNGNAAYQLVSRTYSYLDVENESESRDSLVPRTTPNTSEESTDAIDD